MGSDDKVAFNCPVETTLILIQRKWLMNIVKDMFYDKSRFSQFKQSNPEISNKVLWDCLKYMEDNGLIIKVVNENNKQDIQYFLTNKGRGLNKILYELGIYALYNNYSYDDDKKEEIKSELKEQFNIGD